MPDTAIEFGVDREFNVDKALVARVAANQARLTAALKPRYDFIVCWFGFVGFGCRAQVGRESGRRRLAC